MPKDMLNKIPKDLGDGGAHVTSNRKMYELLLAIHDDIHALANAFDAAKTAYNAHLVEAGVHAQDDAANGLATIVSIKIDKEV